MAGKPLTKPTPPTDPRKPARPQGETTLFWHASGRWAKKILGRFVYFGSGDYQEAIDTYNRQAQDLHAGRRPRDDGPEGFTVYLLAARFLATKKLKVQTGDLSPRSFQDYAATCKLLLKAFGKNRIVADLQPADFEKLRKRMARTWGPVRLGNEINRVRIVFAYAHKNGHIPQPMVYGEGFQRPSRKTLRQHRDAQGPRMFEPNEIRKMLKKAGQPLRTMILLAANCAFGNNDIAKLPIKALDLSGAWINFPRPKTAAKRRSPLWPETVAALRKWLKIRPAPTDPKDADLVFITRYGGPWGIEGRSLSNEMRKLMDKLGFDGHRNFYSLRHGFQTAADETGDFVAVRRLMGHVRDDDIGDVYRERVSDERLKKVTEHVRGWVFG
jgi:integrase